MPLTDLDLEALPEAARLSVVEDPDLFGFCDDEMYVRMSSELKDACRRAAAGKKMKTAQWVRLQLAKGAMGEKHVASVVHQRLGIAPESAQVPARADAPLDAPHGARFNIRLSAATACH